MRYAALVSTAESTRFGPHDVLLDGADLPKTRRSDEALYALSLYIESLKPPSNPNALNEDSKAGEKIFRREGCAGCHTPPLYTNNKLTLAEGFTPPKDISCHPGRSARLSWHRSRSRAPHTERNGFLQSALAARSLVSRPLPA